MYSDNPLCDESEVPKGKRSPVGSIEVPVTAGKRKAVFALVSIVLFAVVGASIAFALLDHKPSSEDVVRSNEDVPIGDRGNPPSSSVVAGEVRTDYDDVGTYLDLAVDVLQAHITTLIETNGGVKAADNPSPGCPSQYYNYVRDQAFAFKALLDYLDTKPDELFTQFIPRFESFVEFTVATKTKNSGVSGWDRGVARYDLNTILWPSASSFCNPQLDGNALRAIVLTRFGTRLHKLRCTAECGNGCQSCDQAKAYIETNIWKSGTGSNIGDAAAKLDVEHIAGYIDTNKPDVDETCDLWQDLQSQAPSHFYVDNLVRRAMHEAAAFTANDGVYPDSGASGYYLGIKQSVTSRLRTGLDSQGDLQEPAPANTYYHKLPNDKIILLTRPDDNLSGSPRHADIQKVLGSIHAYDRAATGDDVLLGPTDPYMQSTVDHILTEFEREYRINQLSSVNTLPDGTDPDPFCQISNTPAIESDYLPQLGIAVGRYIGDDYNGDNAPGQGTCGNTIEVCPCRCRGQPWFVATNAIGEFMYKAADYYLNTAKLITINQVNKAFFRRIGVGALVQDLDSVVYSQAQNDKDFNTIITALIQAGDAQLRRTAQHSPQLADNNWSLQELFNGDTGKMMGARDKTWSYSSFLTAAIARSKLGPEGADKLIESFTRVGTVEAHIVVTGVHVTATQVAIKWDTGCLNLFKTRCVKHNRDQSSELCEWSTFHNFAANEEYAFLAHAGGCNIELPEPRGKTVFRTGNTNLVVPVFDVWGKTPGAPQGGTSPPTNEPTVPTTVLPTNPSTQNNNGTIIIILAACAGAVLAAVMLLVMVYRWPKTAVLYTPASTALSNMRLSARNWASQLGGRAEDRSEESSQFNSRNWASQLRSGFSIPSALRSSTSRLPQGLRTSVNLGQRDKQVSNADFLFGASQRGLIPEDDDDVDV